MFAIRKTANVKSTRFIQLFPPSPISLSQKEGRRGGGKKITFD